MATATTTSPFAQTQGVISADTPALSPINPYGYSGANLPQVTPNFGTDYGSYSGGINGPTASGTNYSGSGIGGTSSSGAGGLFSGLGSLLGSDVGQLGLYSGLYEMIAGQASNAEQENNSLAGQIGAVGAPAVGESQNLLGAYSQGGLTAPYQEQLAASEGQNQLTATSQSQQSAQALANSGGGQNTTSALGSQQQQIQNAQNQANTQAVSNAFQNELTSSNSLLAAGGPYVAQSVQTEITSNTQLQAQLSQLMASLASAYAQGTSGNAAASKAGTGTGTSSSAKPSSSGSGGGGGGGGSGGTGTIGSGSELNPQNPYAYYLAHGGTGLQPIDAGNPSDLPQVDPNFGPNTTDYGGDYSGGQSPDETTGGFYGYY